MKMQNMAKVQKKADSTRFLTVSVQTVKNTWSESHFPKCTLMGAWLRAAGFEVGDQVTVEVEEGRLIVTKR